VAVDGGNRKKSGTMPPMEVTIINESSRPRATKDTTALRWQESLRAASLKRLI